MGILKRWREFPAAADARAEDQRRLEEEVDRVVAKLDAKLDVAGGVAPEAGLPTPELGGHHCSLHERVVTSIDDPYSAAGENVEQWSGSLDDAMQRLARLPDGAGLLEFWKAFKPELAAEPRLIFEETRRVEGHALDSELKRLHVDTPASGHSIHFRSGLPTGEVNWTAYRYWWSTAEDRPENSEAGWQGRAETALDRLRALPESEHPWYSPQRVEEVWQSLN